MYQTMKQGGMTWRSIAIIKEILDYTTEEELIFDLEHADTEYIADVTRSIVFFDGSATKKEIYEALLEYIEWSGADA